MGAMWLSGPQDAVGKNPDKQPTKLLISDHSISHGSAGRKFVAKYHRKSSKTKEGKTATQEVDRSRVGSFSGYEKQL